MLLRDTRPKQASDKCVPSLGPGIEPIPSLGPRAQCGGPLQRGRGRGRRGHRLSRYFGWNTERNKEGQSRWYPPVAVVQHAILPARACRSIARPAKKKRAWSETATDVPRLGSAGEPGNPWDNPLVDGTLVPLAPVHRHCAQSTSLRPLVRETKDRGWLASPANPSRPGPSFRSPELRVVQGSDLAARSPSDRRHGPRVPAAPHTTPPAPCPPARPRPMAPTASTRPHR